MHGSTKRAGKAGAGFTVFHTTIGKEKGIMAGETVPRMEASPTKQRTKCTPSLISEPGER
jgi:hypothetical protein